MSNIVATNRKARRDYNVIETIEAGIVLKGNEVKSLRFNKANIKDSFARIERGEIFLYNLHISLYESSDATDKMNPERRRKLLLHKKEIIKLEAKLYEQGLTLIPLKVYFKRGNAKVELALAKGKRKYDKREKFKKQIHDKEIKLSSSFKKKN